MRILAKNNINLYIYFLFIYLIFMNRFIFNKKFKLNEKN